MGTIAKTAINKWYQCQRKKTWENIKTAKKRAKEFGLYVYECPQCGFYHTTSKPQKDPVS